MRHPVINLIFLIFLLPTTMQAQTQDPAPQNRFLWAAGVMTKPLPERLRAAAAAGFREMSIFPIDVKTWEDQGKTIADLLALSKEADVRFTILDPCTKWVPNWQAPEGMSEEDVAFTDFEVDDFFRMARELGVNRVNMIETFGLDQDREQLVKNLREVCDRADRLGIKVGVEFMPFGHISDLETAHAIIEAADRPNLGYIFDTWHYYRGKVDNDLLRSIPTEQIVALQLADADREIRGDGLMDDLMHYRRTPGTGDFPLTDVLDILLRDGMLREAGTEIFSDEYNAMSAAEAARTASEGLTTLFADGGYRLADQEAYLAIKTFMRSIWRGDRETASAMLAADFSAVGHQGLTVGKDKYLEIHFSQEWRRFEPNVQRIEVSGDLALLYGTVAIDQTDKEFPDQHRFTAVLRKKGDRGYQVLRWQETPQPSGE